MAYDDTLSTAQSLISETNRDAGTVMSTTFQAIRQMAEASQALPPFLSFTAPSVGIVVPSVSSVGPSKPTSQIASIKATLGSPPANFVASIEERITQDVPQETFTTPTIVFPTAPVLVDLIKPSSLPITLPDDIPDVPALTIPTTLDVGGFTFPAVPSIATPNWDLTIPSLNIDLPQTTLNYVEPVYTSALKTAIETALLDGVQNGGTGLNATIETDIWNRQIERLSQQKDDDIEEVISLWAGRGFSMPAGMVAEQVTEVQKRFTDERSQASRDVAIEQARIAKEMTQFFLTTGLNKEQIEINHANNVANRALEAEKSVIEFSIALFNSQVSKFNLQLARYQAKAIEIEGRIKIQALILQAYQAEISSIEVKDKIDRTAIDNYRAILQSHEASIKLYEAEVGAKIAEMNIEAKKIDIFKSQIDAYVAEISAQQSKMDLYRARIAGETAKIDLHKTEVDAYATRVNAVKIANDTIIEKIKSDISIEDMNLRSHLANVEIYKTKSDLAIREVGTEADLYRTDAGIYQTIIDQAMKQAELSVTTQIRAAALDQANAQLALEASRANLIAVTESNKLRLVASQAQANASSALAGMTASAIQGILQIGSQGTSITEVSE